MNEKELSDYVIYSMEYLGENNVKQAMIKYELYLKEKDKFDIFLYEKINNKYKKYIGTRKKLKE